MLVSGAGLSGLEREHVGSLERTPAEIGGLRSWFVGCRLSAFWPAGAPERWPNASRGLAAVNRQRPWAATERLEDRENFENYGLRSGKTLKWWCSGADFTVICENYMLWSGNLGLKIEVSKMAHTQYAYINGSAPPPPGFKPLLSGGFHYFERGFLLQNKVKSLIYDS